MAYLTPANFRPNGIGLWSDLAISTTEADDTRLTAEIEAQSRSFDRATGDRFETVAGATVDFPVPYEEILITTGYRLQSVTSINEISVDGVLTALDATGYIIRPWGVKKIDGLPFGSFGSRAVRLGTFTYGWVTTPGDVKRAVAVLVWDAIKAKNVNRMYAEKWTAGDTEFEREYEKGWCGIPEVDLTVRRYRSLWRPRLLAV